MDVLGNVAEVREQIRQACEKVDRNPEDITIIGVTKYVTIDRAEALLNAGINNLAENRLEGFREKHEKLGYDVKWHFIGSLQSRKVKDMINDIDFLHSLDRKSLAKEINKRATKVIPCFVQVNASGEQSKHGLAVEDAVDFIKSLANFENIRVVGIMTMAPLVDEEQTIRNTFRKVKQLRDEVAAKQWAHAPCDFLSMGMSNDFTIAIEEGATHVRIGSSLVGSNQ
ncbi:YggS family pyridoxal phosphate-dependent enzyme [Radiobacillus sp. PE A8.2]|uniref:YggS family pyridoxal phosphate-dependent enzyme n=1 Tax=Radiobacillus sp. PE A8.2 TaxID=3380349 RepID=UPI00388D4CF5